MKRIETYFKKVSSAEEALPKEWLDAPLPPAPKKRKVGRPPKKLENKAVDNKKKQEESSKKDSDPSLESAAATVVDAAEKTEQLVVPENEHTPSLPQEKRGKYRHYTVSEKISILEEAALHGVRVISRLYKIPVSTLVTWKKQDFKQQRTPGGRLPGGGRKTPYGEGVDARILQWVLEQREQHLPVTSECIMAYALTVIQPKFPDFQASKGWLQNFMRRNDLSLRAKTSLSQKLPADLEDKITSFHKFVKDTREEMEFEEDMIINMDETPLYFDLVPGRIVDQKGTKSVIVRTTGCDKRHLTVVLGVSAAGNVLPTMIIFKGKRQLKDIKAPAGFLVCVQEKAWMDETLMKDWVLQCFRKYTNRQPALLVLDSFRAHLTDTVKKETRKAGGTLAVIPGGCTSKLQPLDVSINKPFKAVVRTKWIQHIRDEVTRVNKAKESGDTNAKVKGPGKQQIVDWIVAAVNNLKEKRVLVQKSFVVTGINTKLNGCDDHLVRKDAELRAMFAEDDDEEADFLGFTEEEIQQAMDMNV